MESDQMKPGAIRFVQHYLGRCNPMTCPICEDEAREEEERIDNMTTEEIRAELIAAGVDVNAVVARVKALIDSYKEKHRLEGHPDYPENVNLP